MTTSATPDARCHPAGSAGRAERTAAGRPGTAVLLVLGSCTSFQFGAALATHLFPVRRRARHDAAAPRRWPRWCCSRSPGPGCAAGGAAQWRPVLLYGVSLAGMNGFYYAALARLPLSAAVTIQFLGPLTLAAALSRRWRDAGWIVLALLGVLTLGLADRHGGGTGPGPDSIRSAWCSPWSRPRSGRFTSWLAPARAPPSPAAAGWRWR